MNKSDILFTQAQKFIPGGVNSPVRAFNGVGGNPVFFERGEGAYLFDVDNNKYIDYVGSWGPMIAGHANSDIIAAVKDTLDKGLGFGAPTAIETELAKKISTLMPSIELSRLVSSGTEATMSAIRLARGYTNRDKIIKFEGCYHGHADSLLVKAGSGALTLGKPSSAGVPEQVAQHTITLEYNNIAQVRDTMAKIGDEVACIIVEPVAGNMGCIPPVTGFLQGLRDECNKSGTLLIFDEVMSGFRVALGGAQSHYQVKPDLTTLGKIIGGGLPIGAFGGRADIMNCIAPLGDVYQAGTLSGNPVSVAAGVAMLKILSSDNTIYTKLNNKATNLVEGIMAHAKANNIAMQANVVGAMFGIFFSDNEIISFADVAKCKVNLFKKFYHSMLQQGIYMAPSAYEAGFVCTAHTDSDINDTIEAAGVALAQL